MDIELLNILFYSTSRAGVRLEEQRMVFIGYGRKYPFRDGIPIILIDKARAKWR